MIRHVWFDFSDTLVLINQPARNRLAYDTYARLKGKPVTPALEAEFDALVVKRQHSLSALFHDLGQSANFWSEQLNAVDPHVIFKLADPRLPEILSHLRQRVPISVFSNIQTERVFSALNLDPNLFTHILSGGMVKAPKPALDGFRKIIELSNLPPHDILFIGDSLAKDVRPAHTVGLTTGLIGTTSNEADYCFEHFDDILKLELG